MIGWVIASVAFAFYVSNFGSYNKTYGALAGPIVFLVWLWISNIMILLEPSSTPSWSAAARSRAACARRTPSRSWSRATRKIEANQS